MLRRADRRRDGADVVREADGRLLGREAAVRDGGAKRVPVGHAFDDDHDGIVGDDAGRAGVFDRSPHGTDRQPDVAIEVGSVAVVQGEIEHPRIYIVRLRRGSPVVAVYVAKCAAIVVAIIEACVQADTGIRNEDAPVLIFFPDARYLSPIHAVAGKKSCGGIFIVDEGGALLFRRHAPRRAEMRRRRVVRRREIVGRVDPALRLQRRIALVVG